MCAKLYEKDINNLEILTSELNKYVMLDDTGKFTGWNAFAYIDLATAMESYVLFDERIPDYDRSMIFNKAIDEAGASGVLTARNLIGSICRKENEHLKIPETRHYLITSISIKYFSDLNKNKKKYNSINFSDSLSEKFDREDFIKEWKYRNKGEPPKDYTWLRISVKARTQYEAFNKAMDKLDLMRGIWNLFLDRRVISAFSRTGDKPTNTITLGALHTLHYPNGKSATTSGLFWYEPDYIEKIIDIKDSWDGLKKFEYQVNKSLSKHLYKHDVEDAIKRYVRALDYTDLHISFLELWSLLEKLTGTINADYDKLVKRVAFLYSDTKIVKPIIQHLRIYRNSNVHTGQRSKNIFQYLQQLKDYVKEALRFHLRNYYKFVNIQDAAEFLDLPTDSAFMKKKIKLLRHGIRYKTS